MAVSVCRILSLHRTLPALLAAIPVGCMMCVASLPAAEPATKRVYQNRLTPISASEPILGDHPEFVGPIEEVARFQAPPLIEDEKANLSVRAWRYSYHARGIIEIPNRLRGDQTALIVVHPWGIDDGQGWKTPEPAGCAFQCTPVKNQIYREHARQVVSPMVESLRGEVSLVMFSLPGREDAIRKKLYRSIRGRPTEAERRQGQQELTATLNRFSYRGQTVAQEIVLSADNTVLDYFRQFPGLDAGAKYNGAGFWELPIPVVKDIQVVPDDIVIYDAEGYALLRNFLKESGIRHVLLAGYNTDKCVRGTCAGYSNLKGDFNVLLVGDATIATFPGNASSGAATTAAVSAAALNMLITQVSWIQSLDER